MDYEFTVKVPKPNHPFLANWLRRTRKQLAPSGRLSELSLLLAQREGNTPEYWSKWLRQVLENELIPTIDELTSIDAMLARPKPQAQPHQESLMLF